MNEGKTEPNFNRTNPLADFDAIEDLLKTAPPPSAPSIIT
ncbi:hypothetical protein J2W43_001059 [Pseudomonas brassicacearum]|uniref:Uncharacterized protein n=1 Tax=Pseudomonas brassicacearum TaxID=930166 RepID=A0AAW8M6U4_9PSED|nr:hypothetical protein [Pseudomonas brassicacearum]